MKISAAEIKQRVASAMSLMSESSTTLEKVQSIAGLVKGINPKLDQLAAECERHCAAIELATTGAFIELSANALPEETEEQKKRKKVLLFFIKSWGELKGEVARVQTEIDAGKSVQSSSFWSSALSGAKGPLAAVTIIAVGVAVMSQTSVDIVIKNEGCPTFYSGGAGISLPGLSLPNEPLVNGGSQTVTIPPLTIAVDGTSETTLVLSSFAFTFDIELSNAVTSVTLDGTSLLGAVTEIKLSEKDSHTLQLVCN